MTRYYCLKRMGGSHSVKTQKLEEGINVQVVTNWMTSPHRFKRYYQHFSICIVLEWYLPYLGDFWPEWIHDRSLPNMTLADRMWKCFPNMMNDALSCRQSGQQFSLHSERQIWMIYWQLKQGYSSISQKVIDASGAMFNKFYNLCA